MKLNYGVAILLALILAPLAGIARAMAPKGRDALNIQGTHDGTVTRTAEGALAAHLLVAFGTTAGTQVKPCTAALRPLGTVYDDAADTDPVTVELFANGETKLLIASKAIAAGAAVYTTASGKVTDAVSHGCYQVGYALTAAAADGAEIEVQTSELAGPLHLTTATAVAGAVLAIPLTSRSINKTTGGAEALTLADGLWIGQRININLVAQAGTGTLTPATATAWTSIALAEKGQGVELEWTTSGWRIIGFSWVTTKPLIAVP